MKRVYKYIIVITVCFTGATKSYPHEFSPSISTTHAHLSSSSEPSLARENQAKMEATSQSQPNMSLGDPNKQHLEESDSYGEHKAIHMKDSKDFRGEERNKRHVHLDIGHHHHIPFRFGYGHGHGSHEHDYHHHHIGYNGHHHHHHHDDHWH